MLASMQRGLPVAFAIAHEIGALRASTRKRGLRALCLICVGSIVFTACAVSAQSLRFFGHGGSPGDQFVFPDRVKIDRTPPSSANVGQADFTVEFWMRAEASDNPNTASCGGGNDWVNSNIIIDADRFNQNRAWGIGLLNSAIVFGIIDEFGNVLTLCGSTNPLDDEWHHVAVDRRASDGRMRTFIDGILDIEGPAGGGGPTGDVSYPVGAIPGNYCSSGGGSGSEACLASDPFLVFGAEKHGFNGINYSGFLDEVRLSNGIRHPANFALPNAPFVPDGTTAALYHFDEGQGTTVADASGQGSNGTISFGGTIPSGPVWSLETPFVSMVPTTMRRGQWIILAIVSLLGTRALMVRRAVR